MATYEVEEAKDDTGHLRDVLQRIAQQGGRVVSITWQPARAAADGAIKHKMLTAGYTVVFEVGAPAGG